MKDFRPTVGQKYGRPKEVNSIRSLAERSGYSRMMVWRTKAHVECADRYPFMQARAWCLTHALRVRSLLLRLMRWEHDYAAALIESMTPRDAIRFLEDHIALDIDERARRYGIDEEAKA